MIFKCSQTGQRGRPADPRKDAQILEAASRLFMAQGVQGTTMEQIAREADVSKLTLYRRYPDKNALFTEVISQKCCQHLPEEIFTVTPNTSPEESLMRLGTGLLQLCTSEDAVSLNRVIMAESTHNPSLTQVFYSSGPLRLKTNSIEMMKVFKANGSLNYSDPAEASELFLALIVGSELNKRCSMHISPTPQPEEITAYVRKAVAMFLCAYGR